MKAETIGTARSPRGRLRRKVAVRVYLFALLLTVSQQLPALEAFTHEATEDNTFLHATSIDHPAINDDPNAIIIVTHVYNPDGNPSGVENEDFPEVSYNDSSGRWMILNVNVSTMPVGAAFNVLVAESGDTAFIHQAEESFHTTNIDHPSLNDNSNAQFLVTRHSDPRGSVTPQVDDAITVQYNGSSWSITAFDSAGAETIPEGAAFNIIVPSNPDRTFGHSVQDWNLSADASYSYIDVPAANGSSDAKIFLTHFGPRFGHHSLSVPFGSLYDLFEGKWAVFRQDGGELSVNTFFFGYVAGGSPEGDSLFADRFEEP